MTTRKKIIALALSVVLIIFAMATLIACTGQDAGAPYNIIIANNDNMAVGAANGLKELAKDIPIIGVDATDEAIEKIETGEIFGTVKQEIAGMADVILDISANFLKDKFVGTPETEEQPEIPANPNITITESFQKTKWYNDEQYHDTDLDLGDPDYNYTKKQNKVRMQYSEYDGTPEKEFDKKDLHGKKIKVFLMEAANAYLGRVQAAMVQQSSLTENDFIPSLKQEQTEQDNQIETELNKSDKPDLLLVNPVEPEQTENIVKKCKDAGVPVIFFNKENRTYDYSKNDTLYIGSGLDGGGIIQGEMVARMLTDQNSPYKVEAGTTVRPVLLYGDPGHADALFRTLTWIRSANKLLEGKEIKIDFDLQINGNVNIKYMPSKELNWSADGARAVIETLITSPGFKTLRKSA
ncbi:MAG: substrate-binding domain-containing protein [Firmicutes bacterium]|nr:substrate-binding domain-containing protein [Bacillota bacterium]